MIKLGAMFREIRVYKGLSMAALAEKAGVGESTIYMLEKERGYPRIDTVMLIAEGLEVPLSKIIEEAEYAEQHGED